MCRLYFLLIPAICFTMNSAYGQATLPDFTLKNNKGEISVLWLNQYPKQVNGISIQRSYDSTKNFTSIASVFNPQNTINGFTDLNPPYNKMYYRLFIGFDTGVYILSESKRPDVNTDIDYTLLIIEINAVYERNIQLYEEKVKAQKEAALARAAKLPAKSTVKKGTADSKAKTNTLEKAVDEALLNDVITYPSKRVFTDKDNNIVVKLPNTKTNKYSIKFYTESYKPLFTLNHLADDFYIIEKVNFGSSGWYLFEIFKNEILFEENKFFIARDEKLNR